MKLMKREDEKEEGEAPVITRSGYGENLGPQGHEPWFAS